MRPWLVYLGELRVPTYFFMLMFGFALCSGVIAREARRAGIGERRIIDLSLLLIPAALVGARLFHAIFERPGFYLENPLALLNFSGGLVFYGGFAGAWVVGLWWCRRHQLSFWQLADVFTPATAFGLVYGRLGCLGAGCGYGRPADWPLGVQVPWAVRYYRRGVLPEELLGLPLHPAPLYESLGCLALFWLLCRTHAHQRFSGQTALTFVAGYGLLRIVVEYFRADVARGVYLDGWLSTSQGLSLLLLAGVPFAWRYLGKSASR